eukprot:14051451-Alexandrium_andersonii.AAC.1
MCAGGIRSLARGHSRCPRCQAPDAWRRRGPPVRGGTFNRLSWFCVPAIRAVMGALEPGYHEAWASSR